MRLAIVACGTVVHMVPDEFLLLLAGIEVPLVVEGREPRLFGTPKYQYLTSHRGLAFYTKSAEPLKFPGPVELIQAKSISAPRI